MQVRWRNADHFAEDMVSCRVAVVELSEAQKVPVNRNVGRLAEGVGVAGFAAQKTAGADNPERLGLLAGIPAVVGLAGCTAPGEGAAEDTSAAARAVRGRGIAAGTEAVSCSTPKVLRSLSVL